MYPRHTSWQRSRPCIISRNGQRLRTGRNRVILKTSVRNTHDGVATCLLNSDFLLQTAIRLEDERGLTTENLFILLCYDDQRSVTIATHGLNKEIIIAKFTGNNRVHCPCTVGIDVQAHHFITSLHHNLLITTFYYQRLVGRLGIVLFVRLARSHTSCQRQGCHYCYIFYCLHISCSFGV